MLESTKIKIKESLQATREKRRFQICKVFELKIDQSHLSKKEIEQLKMYFIEAKWLYNFILSKDDPFKYDYKTNPIQRLNNNRDSVETKLQFLPPRFKQTVVSTLKNSIKGLSESKKRGRKVGKLKFKSEYNSIDMNENSVTHYISGKNRFKILGIKKHLVVKGLHQITSEMEIANAKLMQKPDGFYIKVTTFQYPKGEVVQKEKKHSVGLDFGIQRNITTSDGEFINVSIGESERLKRLQRKFAKSKKSSNNRNKLRNLIQIEYQKITNQKKDKANKIVNYLLSNYNTVVMQDENLKGWKSSRMKGWGRRMQHSVMGTVKAKLKLSNQVIMLDRMIPTTKMCLNCGCIKDKNILSERVFTCECGYSDDRDIKSAKTILKIGLMKGIGTERIEFKPVEKKSDFDLTLVGFKHFSMKQEALSFMAG